MTYLEQIQLICDGKLFKIFPAQGKRLQFKDNDDNTLQAMADEASWLKTMSRNY